MKKQRAEYNSILKEMLVVDKYRSLDESIHHGISRFDHITRVGYLSFLIAKALRMDVTSATRGALLHDFFTEEDVKSFKKNEKFRNHPQIALENSLRYFELNHIERNIISSHMFPLNRTRPRYRESHVVATADKLAAIYELMKYGNRMARKRFFRRRAA